MYLYLKDHTRWWVNHNFVKLANNKVEPRLQLKYPGRQLDDEITKDAFGSVPAPALPKYCHTHEALVLLGWALNNRLAKASPCLSTDFHAKSWASGGRRSLAQKIGCQNLAGHAGTQSKQPLQLSYTRNNTVKPRLQLTKTLNKQQHSGTKAAARLWDNHNLIKPTNSRTFKLFDESRKKHGDHKICTSFQQYHNLLCYLLN